MSVRNLLKSKNATLVTTHSRALVADVVGLLLRHNIAAAPVVEPDGRLVGIVSERDLVRALQLQSGQSGRVQDIPVARVMQRDAPTCSADTSLLELMQRMTRERLRHVLVTDAGALVGIVSVGDMVKHRLDQLEVETSILRDYVTASRATV